VARVTENLNIVEPSRLMGLLEGRTKDEIDADLMNRVMISQSDLPVFPMFVRDTHVAKSPLHAASSVALQAGLDFGPRPAAIV
jgi:hypothetical protein